MKFGSIDVWWKDDGLCEISCLFVLSTLAILQMPCHERRAFANADGHFIVEGFRCKGGRFPLFFCHAGSMLACRLIFLAVESLKQGSLSLLPYSPLNRAISRDAYGIVRLGNAGDDGRHLLVFEDGFVVLLSLDEGFLEVVGVCSPLAY